MNTAFFIAKRYLFSKKTHNVINIISAISVFGITVSTAALVIVLSAFNGLESFVISIFSEFESDVKIYSQNTRSFDPTLVPSEILEDNDVADFSQIIEEIGIIKFQENFVIGKIKGVENTFLDMTDMEDHLIDGKSTLSDKFGPLGLVGVIALQNLDAGVFSDGSRPEVFTIYAPNKNEKISRNNVNAFTTTQVPVIGTFSFNNKVDGEYLVVPLALAADIFDYKNLISGVEIKLKPGIDLTAKKIQFQSKLNNDFKVETALERNQLIYQTSQSEKWVTALLLAFIFFLSTFNMIASITMLIIEKQQNLKTLFALGAVKKQLQRIFFYEGLLINGLGLMLGLAIGYGICFLQQKFGFIKMEGGLIDYYPVSFKLTDLFLILGISVLFGTLAAFVPSKLLIKRTISDD